MKDTLCAYYTNSKDIVSYMVKKINPNDNDCILEPSAGEGVFIDEILKTGRNMQIDALDINVSAISILQKKYGSNSAISIRKTDTLFDKQLDSFCLNDGHYTKIIGNPPYGAWLDYEKRDILKKKYSNQYVKETYSLFLLRCISVLKMHGRLSFIIPDTFLFLNMHSQLRETLLNHTKIDEILLFPSNFFPGVSFGYSNLSIITLERCESREAQENIIRIVKGFRSTNEFELLFSNDTLPNHLQIYNLKQKEIYSNTKHQFILAENTALHSITTTPVTLGDIADVVTGFYTGDNVRFIKVLDKTVKGAKKYSVVNEEQIFNCTSLEGIPDVSEGYIPYIKSSSKNRYIRDNDEWFVRWDKATIALYNTDKKSRFQNSSYYFKTGIGIPMVKANSIRAFMMQDHVFDQSIVGIFPKDKRKLLYILALMNSDSINKLIHILNPTANNSANYVKQLPYYEPDKKTFNIITNKVKEIINSLNKNDYTSAEQLHGEVNEMIDKIYTVSVA